MLKHPLNPGPRGEMRVILLQELIAKSDRCAQRKRVGASPESVEQENKTVARRPRLSTRWRKNSLERFIDPQRLRGLGGDQCQAAQLFVEILGPARPASRTSTAIAMPMAIPNKPWNESRNSPSCSVWTTAADPIREVPEAAAPRRGASSQSPDDGLEPPKEPPRSKIKTALGKSTAPTIASVGLLPIEWSA